MLAEKNDYDDNYCFVFIQQGYVMRLKHCRVKEQQTIGRSMSAGSYFEKYSAL